MIRKLSFLFTFVLGLAGLFLSAGGAQAMTPEARSTKIAMLAVGASMIELPPAWICEIIFAAELAAEALCDPPPCQSAQYTSLVPLPAPAGLMTVRRDQLKRLFSGAVDDGTVALYQRAIDGQVRVAADELAVAETTARHGVAVAHKNEKLAVLQLQYAQKLARRAATDKRDANELWSALLDRLDRAKLGDIALHAAGGISLIRKQGFSPATVTALRRLGMTDDQMSAARASIAAGGAVQRLGTFRDVIRGIVRLNRSNHDMETCSCRIAAGG
jgi:hypothetical protein